MTRRRWSLTAVLVALGLVATACGGAGAKVAEAAPASKGPAGANVNPATSPESSTVFRWGNSAWSATLSYNPYNPDFLPNGVLALQTLAAYSNSLRPGPNPYLPELASGWTVKGHTITFHIRRNATWQNGRPLTSADVVESLLLAGADYNSAWAAIASISAPDAHEVVLQLHSWVVPENVMENLFQINILPKSQYGFMIPSGFTKDLLSYWKAYDFLHPTQATIQAASNSPAGKVVAAAQAKLVKFQPRKLIGNGPYKVKTANVSGILYEKWMGWWDAKVITAPWIEMVPLSIASQYGGLVGGTLELETDTQFTDPQVTKMQASRYGRYVFIPSPVQQASLVFHLSNYPFNLRQVRQALAYVINRTKIAQLDMGGSLIQNPAVKYPDGINYQMAKQYITPAEFKHLNQYRYNPAKATKLLESAHFTKRHGVWYTAKGKPFTVLLSEQSGSFQWSEDGLAVAQQLKKFGIKATTQVVNEATYYSQQEAGDYAVSENYMDWGGTPNPIADFSTTFAPSALPAFNYPISYNGAKPFNGHVGIGIGPISNVPGLGKVNIGAALNNEVNTAPPSKWPQYTYDWARWINQNLPLLGLYNNAFHEAYDTSRYVDWPPKSKKWLWTGLGGAAQPVMMMQDGYLRLRK